MKLFIFSHTRSFLVYLPVRLFTAPGDLLSKTYFMDCFELMCRISLRFGVHGKHIIPDAVEGFMVVHPELLALY